MAPWTGFIKKIQANIVNKMLGDRSGLTVIGPASVVKQIKKDPEKIELFTTNGKTTKTKKKRGK